MVFWPATWLLGRLALVVFGHRKPAKKNDCTLSRQYLGTGTQRQRLGDEHSGLLGIKRATYFPELEETKPELRGEQILGVKSSGGYKHGSKWMLLFLSAVNCFQTGLSATSTETYTNVVLLFSLLVYSCSVSPPKRSRGKPALAKVPSRENGDISGSGVYQARGFKIQWNAALFVCLLDA